MHNNDNKKMIKGSKTFPFSKNLVNNIQQVNHVQTNYNFSATNCHKR